MVFSLFGERGAELDLEDELEQWRGALEPDAAAAQELLPAVLRPYQAHGVRWMANCVDMPVMDCWQMRWGWVKRCRC